MKKILVATCVTALLFVVSSCKPSSGEFKTISPEVLKDKIAGGWAGKMIGVTYGAPTEFRAQGKTYDGFHKLETIRYQRKYVAG